MKNTTPILVLTGLAIAAAVGLAGLTREQWMGQPTPAVATPDPAQAPAEPAAPAETAVAPVTPQAPAEPPETATAPAGQEPPATGQTTAATEPAQPQETAAVQPDSAEPVQPEPAAQPEAAQPAAQPEAAQPAAQPEAAQPAAQPEVQPAQNAVEKPEVPAFDTVRVEKTGDAVIAGRAKPGSEVVVKLNGEEIGKTVANAEGAFVVVPEKPLPSGSGAITIEATGKGDLEPLASQESVAVIVPEGESKQALVAVVSPEAPTKVLQSPEAPAVEPEPAAPEQAAAEQPAAPEAPAKLVSIDAVDYDTGGNIVFSGQGEAGNTARVYVDNNFLGDAPVGQDGRWTFAGTADVAQGVHTLRVDGLDAQGNVVNRVEVPFFREEQTKVAQATQPAAPAVEEPAVEEPAAEPPMAEQPAPAGETVEEQTETASGEPATAAEAPAVAAAQPQPATEQEAEEEAAAGQTDSTPPAAEQPAAPTASAEEPAATDTATVSASEATTQQAQETAAATAPAEQASPAIPKEGRIVIQPGNNLWRISRVLYGSGNKFTMLYEANKDQIRNPNLIYPGQVFRTPDVAPKAEAVDPKRRDPLTPDENAAAAE